MTNAILRGKPDAGNPHVRFDEGEVASAKPRRGSLLYKEMMQMFALVGAICLWALTGVAGKVETAVFVVEGKEVPVGELTVAWEAGSFMYDNTGKTKGIARGT